LPAMTTTEASTSSPTATLLTPRQTHLHPQPTRTMLAVVKIATAAGAELREMPVPVPQPNEVLIKVRATSICGTDLHIYNWDGWAQGRISHTPQIMGHEFCGDIVAVGADVQELQVGDFVSVETHITCGHCYQCRTGLAHICQNVQIVGVDRDGCFAEYITVPASVAWKNDPAMPLDLASIMEPFGNAVHTTFAQPVSGEYVAVVGCGPLGLWAIGIAKAAGAAGVAAIDVNPFRLNIARQMGADLVINSLERDPVAAVQEASGGVGAGVVLEMSGNPAATRQAFAMLRYGGNLSMLGTPTRPFELDFAEAIIFKGAHVHGITGRKIWGTWFQSRALLQNGLVDPRPVITHHLPLARFAEAFELMNEGKAAKIVMTPLATSNRYEGDSDGHFAADWY